MVSFRRRNVSETVAQHKANIAAVLARRIEAARATNNQSLLDQLERERQMLIPDVDLPR